MRQDTGGVEGSQSLPLPRSFCRDRLDLQTDSEVGGDETVATMTDDRHPCAESDRDEPVADELHDGLPAARLASAATIELIGQVEVRAEARIKRP
ncbi:MAG: hypothetical protein AB8H79_02050 [Myxococcota bacterium]